MIEDINIGLLAIILLIGWITYIFLKIYFKRKLMSFLLVGLSLPFYLFSIPLLNVPKIILQTVSNTLFWIGVIVMGTCDKAKLNELREITSIKDWLTGHIPDSNIKKEIKESRAEQIIFILSSSVLVAVSVINYFYFHGELTESVAMFITGLTLVCFCLIRGGPG